MRKKVSRVFDQYLGVNGATSIGRTPRVERQLEQGVDFFLGRDGATTDRKMEEALGRYDQLGLLAVVDDVSAASSVTFSLFIDHSADGFHWLPARAQPNQTPPFHTGAGDIVLTVSSSSPGVGWYVTAARGVSIASASPTANGPLLHYVRLYMLLSSGTAHVRVHAFQRDIK